MIDDAARFDDTLIGLRKDVGSPWLRAEPLLDALGVNAHPASAVQGEVQDSHDDDPLGRKTRVGGIEDKYWDRTDNELFVAPAAVPELAPDDKEDDAAVWAHRVDEGELPASSSEQIWEADTAAGQLMGLFRDQDVRIVEDMIVLSDVAAALGYRDASTVSRSISDRYKGTHAVCTPGGEQQMSCAHRKGVLEALMHLSPQQPEKQIVVEQFRHWALDVLVEVLETGSYNQDELGHDLSRWEMRDMLRDWVQKPVSEGIHFHTAPAWYQLYNRLKAEHGIDADALQEKRGEPSKIKSLDRRELDTAIRAAARLWD